VAHVELSWTEPSATHQPRSATRRSRTGGNSVDRWAAAVDGANEPCMVIDRYATIASISATAITLLGFASTSDALGQCLYDRALPLIDFTADGSELGDDEIQRTPSVVALTSGLLARGVLRVRTGGEVTTMDAVATPLRQDDAVVGSLTFFSVV